MRRVIATVSLAALLSGAAWAQDQGTRPGQPAPAVPAASPAPQGGGNEVSADKMIGQDVYGENNEELGEVTDVIIDPQSKQISKIVVGSGGFLGIGQKTVAIEVDKVQVRPQEGIYVTGLTQQAVKDMPEYDADASTVSLQKPPPTNPAPGAGAGRPDVSPAMPSPSGTAPPPDLARPSGQAPNQ
jgi:sporulation protein YlmC with PRC-barrel domain